MPGRERIGARAARWILSAIVIGASALALRWVFLVPVFQSPDEQQHLDYALCLRDAGHFFRAVRLGANKTEFSHPWTQYLSDCADDKFVRSNPTVKVPPEYGTRAYYRAIDRGAPPLSSVTIDQPPRLAVVYPYGYYALLAGWLKLVGLFSGRVTVMFFAARILSVILLAISLVAGYLAAREVRVGRGAALLATAIVGFFPVTTFVASYVQPDNLSFALVSVGLCLALRTARRGAPALDLALLGLVWGALLVTKPHFFACLVVTTTPLIALKKTPRRWPLAIALLAWPSIPLWLIFAWIVRDVPMYYAQVEPISDLVTGLPERLTLAFNNYFRDTTHLTFWGIFGWIDTPLELAAPRRVIFLIRFLAMAGTWLVLGLALLRIEQNASRILRVASRGRWRSAARLTVADPIMNTYFVFFALMVYAFVRMNNRFGAQGRNWVPVMLPLVLLAIRFAPRALSGRWSRRLVSSALAMGLVAYVSLGSVYAVRAIKTRYYPPPERHPTRRIALPTRPDGIYMIDWRGDEGRALSNDASMCYALKKPEYIRNVELRFTLESDAKTEKPAAFRVLCTNSRDSRPITPNRVHSYGLPVGPRERTLIIAVNDVVDHIRIEPDTRPCRIAMRSVALTQPIRRLASR